jgi:hypothetical protein
VALSDAETARAAVARGPVALATQAPARLGGRVRHPSAGHHRFALHPAVIVVGAACAALFREAMHTGLSGDVFFQLAAGRWMLAHHAVVNHDVFSYTVRGRPWLDEEWGFQLLLALLVAHIGPISYWLVSAGACTCAVLASVARWLKLGAGWLWAAAISVLAAAGLSVGLAPRPQDLSYLLFALLLSFLTSARRRTAWLLALPPLFAIWANLHGSFLLGLGVLVIELAWSLVPCAKGRLGATAPLSKRAAAFALAASTGAALLNPHGPKLIAYALGVSSAPQLGSLISEWQSPDFHSTLLLVAIALPTLAIAALLAATSMPLAPGDLVIAGLLFVATLHAVRFTPYFTLAACSVLARWHPLPRESLRPTALAFPCAAGLAAALLVGPHVAAGAPAIEAPLGTPVKAVKFLEHQRGRVFTTYWWSDYLIAEHVPVFVDGRTDLYFGTGILQKYVQVSGLALDPDKVFRQWHVRWVMWGERAAVATYLYHDPHWRPVLRVEGAVVFEHTGSW